MVLIAPVLVLRNRYSVITIFAFSHLAPPSERYVSKNTFYAFHMMIASPLQFSFAPSTTRVPHRSLACYSALPFSLGYANQLGRNSNHFDCPTRKISKLQAPSYFPAAETFRLFPQQASILAASIAGVVSQQHFLFRSPESYLSGNRIRT